MSVGAFGDSAAFIGDSQIWCAIVALATDLTAWMQLLALTDHCARRSEPQHLRHRLLTIPPL